MPVRWSPRTPGLTAALPDPYHRARPWQGPCRVGHFDAVAHRYAAEVGGGVDGLALTHLDAPARAPHLGICRAYREPDGCWARIVPGVRGDLRYQAALARRLAASRPAVLDRPAGANEWPEVVADPLGAPVVLGSVGPRTTDKWFAAGSRTRAR